MASQGMSNDARRKANLRVLQRGDSEIIEIVESATHVGLYEFLQDQHQWEKKQVEGSLFLAKRGDEPQFQLIILNRSSTDNWALDVNPKLQLQNKDPYLILRHKSASGESVIQGIWFHNGTERDIIADLLQKTVQTLQQQRATSPKVDHGAAASALLSPLTLGNHTIPVSHGPPPSTTSPMPKHLSPLPQPGNLAETTQQPNNQQPMGSEQQNQQHFVLDKKSLQLSLLSLIQDERFLDLIHAQYLKVAHARANRKPDNGNS